MKFNSIKEYFYKLYNVCYLFTLVPLTVFIFLYLELQEVKTNSFLQESTSMLIVQIAFFVLAFIVLTSVHLVIRKRMKLLSRELSLGNKMDRYFYLSLIRIGSGALASVVMGVGLFLTGSEAFSVFFLGIMLWMAYHWPLPKKLCEELQLKGDEREMVLYRREFFN